MYLDPGIAGMAVQGFFAVIAALLTAFSIPRKLINLARRFRSPSK